MVVPLVIIHVNGNFPDKPSSYWGTSIDGNPLYIRLYPYDIDGFRVFIQLFLPSTSSTLWLFNIAMENGPFMEVYLLKMVIFHGYVK